MRKISLKTIQSQSKNSLPTLYAQLGTAYYLKKNIKGAKTSSYSKVKLAYKKRIIPKSKAQKEGRRQYLKFRKIIRRLICIKLKWCKQREKISKRKNVLTYGMLTSQIISAYVPEWAISGGLLVPLGYNSNGSPQSIHSSDNHLEKSPYKCEHCDFIGITEEILWNHYNDKHPDKKKWKWN